MKWSHGFTVAPGLGFYKKSRHSVGGAKDLSARKASTPIDDVTNVSLFRFSKPVALDTDTPTAPCRYQPVNAVGARAAGFSGAENRKTRHRTGYKKKRVERTSSTTRLFSGAMYRA